MVNQLARSKSTKGASLQRGAETVKKINSSKIKDVSIPDK